MPDLDLSALRKVAEAATPGGWHAVPEAGDLIAVESRGMVATITMWSDADANHIAAFDPPTVLALLDELENARTTIEEDKRHFAKAWDEGFDAGERDVMQHETFDEPCVPNPYRAE